MPGSKYTKVLKMPGLQRAMKMPETFLNMPIYAWICLNMLNMLEFLKCLKTFTKKNVFLIVPISLRTIKGVIYFKWKLTLSKTKHLLMSLLDCKEESFSLFHLIGVASGTFQIFPSSYRLFWVVPLFTSDKVAEYFDLQFYCKSTSKKECKSLYKARQLFWITNRSNFYYKVGQ